MQARAVISVITVIRARLVRASRLMGVFETQTRPVNAFALDTAPPLMNSWMISRIQVYGALNVTPITGLLLRNLKSVTIMRICSI